MNSVSRSMVCIIGAGPYGLAIAAHMQFADVEYRIFGSPMRRWLSQMPKSMLLKSEGCASSLPDPTGCLGLARYCREESLPYSDYGAPVSRDIFASYGLYFQRKLVPHVEDVLVSNISHLPDGLETTLSTGEKVRSTHVVVATGMDYMAHVPEQLSGLPTTLWSHAADHYDLSIFKGKDVVVIGGGQSALETAAILREEGASVNLVARRPTIAWNRVPSTAHRPFYQRLRRPRTRLGEGLQLWVYDNAPLLFHHLPRHVRISRVKASLGPAGAWWLKDRVIGQMPVHTGHHIRAVEARGGRVELQMADASGRPKALIADHVIAATGYRFDVENLPFLDQGLKSRIRREERLPALSPYFESSVPGLYFVGVASAYAFGPAMRFVAGTDYTARRISSHIANNRHSPGIVFTPAQKCLET
ncbi:NAD(P)-binding domain-containing protein [Rhodoblastus sp.]|uniref:NAD(P)-binding domain-containing protein n=1 Tax=Rhodoblastus sp. TaxID=1962975 RepID=UPI002611488B|nr:NAD(P)-binding domain-containing protein [Rhodoblastus sp.]